MSFYQDALVSSHIPKCMHVDLIASKLLQGVNVRVNITESMPGNEHVQDVVY